MKELKNLFIFTAIAAVVSLGLKMVVDTPFWAIFILLQLCYGIFLLSQRSKLAGTIAGLVLTVVLVGGFAFSWFNSNMPISANTLSLAKFGADLIVATKMGPSMTEAKTKLLLYHRQVEKEMADNTIRLAKQGRWSEATALIRRWEENKKEVEAVILPQSEKPTSAAPVSSFVSPKKKEMKRIWRDITSGVFHLYPDRSLPTVTVPSGGTVHFISSTPFFIDESRAGGKHQLVKKPAGKSEETFPNGGIVFLRGINQDDKVMASSL